MKKIFLTVMTVIFTFFILSNFNLMNLLAIKQNIAEKSLNEIREGAFEYKVQDHLKPKDLVGISNLQIDDHWKLYKGYVDQVNKLNKELNKLRSENKGADLNYSDRRRRYGFEYNGMVLHEYYFGNLCAGQSDKPNGKLLEALEKNYGSFDSWKTDFINAGKTRGIGWAILFMDPINKTLINVFVQDHEVGNISSFIPILVMDVWEHAYMVDYFAGERGNYIEAFLKNVNWPIVEKRFESAIDIEIYPRS